jgi:nitroimidazol reductase NimA-like FMN-containing flavoprotein (pyridoxamine 5'-phosphate oxidase superfamily)
MSIQYESAVVFGTVTLVEDPDEQRIALRGLIGRYFPDLTEGEHYRPIQDAELEQTAVYSLAVERWSGKRNWKERADQTGEWPALPESLFE